MKKVLIITYYWPPSGGSGVQRWLKFVKYLPAFGWEPHVFTPENPAFTVRDPSLEKDVPPEAEVMRFPIWEPYDIFRRISKLAGSGKEAAPAAFVPSGKRSLFQSISTWIRGNLFIPDPRVFWVRPSVRFLADYVRDNNIGIVITTGPPHSTHLIGLRLKKKNAALRWIADFRDPWSEWGIWDSLMVNGPARRVHRRLERAVLTAADEIITITPFYARQFERLARRPVRLLTNGFDEDDFRGLVYKRPEKFTLRHVGIVNEKCDPRPFMLALKSEVQENPEMGRHVRLEFTGEVHPDFREFVRRDEILESITLFSGSIPHDKLISIYGSSSLLLLILTGYKDAEGFLPGKLFEYIATGLPVLGVGPVGGDAAEVLKESAAGTMVDAKDSAGMRKAIQSAFEAWKSPSGIRRSDTESMRRYSRKVVTAQLAAVLSQHLSAAPSEPKSRNKSVK